MRQDEAIERVLDERDLQNVKWAGRHMWGVGDCSSGMVDTSTKIAVLTEEVGEVARAYLERDLDGLRTELVQVAAVAVAILESL